MSTGETNAKLIEQLVSLSAMVVGMTKSLVEAEGLTESQANLLWLVDPAAEPLPLRQLAVRLRCDPSNITLISAKLEEKGLAVRAPHPADGRIRTLVLTEAGEQARERLVASTYTRSPLTVLAEREQRQLHRLLDKVLGAAG